MQRLVAESASTDAPPIVDFAGVEGMAPSFLDELLSVFEAVMCADASSEITTIVITNPPARLSLKFEAVARGHGLSVRATEDGAWLLSSAHRCGSQPLDE